MTVDDSIQADIKFIQTSTGDIIYGIAKIKILAAEKTIKNADPTLSLPTYREVVQRFSM